MCGARIIDANQQRWANVRWANVRWAKVQRPRNRYNDRWLKPKSKGGYRTTSTATRGGILGTVIDEIMSAIIFVRVLL